eukprot:409186_1
MAEVEEQALIVNQNNGNESLHLMTTESKFYQKWSFWIFLSISIIVVAVIAVAIVVIHNSANKTKPEAVNEIGHILEEVVNGSNVTNYMAELHESFDVFDEDNDGIWSANELSSYLQSTTSSEDVFHIMDVNGDNILSFREVVAILTAMNSIPTVSEIMHQQFGAVISLVYNYSYSQNDSLYFQYAADLFFNAYDADYTGYITKDMYFDVYANKYFPLYDIDGDSVITFDEFISDTFNNNTLTYLSAIGIDNIHHMNSYLQMIKLNESHVENIDLTICPSTHYKISEINEDNMLSASIQRRLLQDGTQCAGHSTVCGAAIAIAIVCMIFTSGLGAPLCIPPVISFCGEAVVRCMGWAVESGGCFAGSNTIIANQNGVVTVLLMNQIQIGDYVLSKDGWSKVWFINNHFGDYLMVDLFYNYSCQSDYNYSLQQYISLTPDHLLYIDDLDHMNMKRADQVQIGDTILTSYNGLEIHNETLCDSKIIDVRFSVAHNAYSPITMDGTIVVSNVLASSYTKSVTNARRFFSG